MIFNLTAGSGKAKIAYSGTCTTESYTADGQAYTLYKITGSGTLTVKGRAKGVAIWLCGGGANGSQSGGGGAYCAQYNAQTLSGSYTFAIGAATGTSSITQNSATVYTANGATGKNGGTGGGSGEYWSRAGDTGDGITKYPFGDTTNFDPHCAGGGGGSGVYYTGNYEEYNDQTRQGGKGGTNGGAGGRASTNTVYSWSDAAGGNKGGGTGGAKRSGSAATFYGSGGGGGGCDGDIYGYVEGSGFPHNKYYSGGAGYQGIVYLRVPA